ncbi:DUF3892 domain-containing protein [Arcobacter sp. YIC-464]|uniref:DUF3892 domain-containing protein n=1 Tax=Arcobacter sp. YIC-464 TaxID=3376631 RepID=UPI003C27B373
MAESKSITGTQSGLNGRNDFYMVRGRGLVSRKTMVKETLEGKHNVGLYKRGKEIFLKAYGNKNKLDNINKRRK